MLCDPGRTFGSTPGYEAEQLVMLVDAKRKTMNVPWGPQANGGTPVGECLRLAFLEFTEVSKLRPSCPLDIGLPPSLPERAGPNT